MRDELVRDISCAPIDIKYSGSWSGSITQGEITIFRRCCFVLAFLLSLAALVYRREPVTEHGETPKSPSDPSRSSQPQAVSKARLQAGFGKMPLYFVENRGQVDSRVAYYVRGSDKSIYFTERRSHVRV